MEAPLQLIRDLCYEVSPLTSPMPLIHQKLQQLFEKNTVHVKFQNSGLLKVKISYLQQTLLDDKHTK